ncbi:intraflagellar transport protein 140 homolog [Ornithodoros turicata]|uniref:intraflagellar transport protein 140 homolog n=1 Tax=Ornithodoros turicata TaxID=34597 RepID=UPI00313A2920
MSVFLDLKIDETGSETTKCAIAWHRLHPILAVAVFDHQTGEGAVQLYAEDGSELEADIPRKQSVRASTIAWHPKQRFLAIGWENGEVCVWNDHGHELHEPHAQHKRAASGLRWSDGGNRIVSVDSVGTCIGWKVDARGALSTVFFHELRDSLTDIAFRSQIKKGELSRLARAAVEGDEDALNIFSDWSAVNKNRSDVQPTDAHDFYVGSLTGVVYFVGENGSCGDVLQMDGGVTRLLHYPEKDILVVVTDALVLAQYAVSRDGSLTELNRVKLSGHGPQVRVIWAGKGMLAISAGEGTGRLLDLDSCETSVLVLPDLDMSETITCMVADMTGTTLATGTSIGRVVVWKRVDSSWKALPVTHVDGPVKDISWCDHRRALGVVSGTSIYVLSEHESCFSYRNGSLAVQTAAKQVFIDNVRAGIQVDIQTEVPVKSLFVNETNVAVSNGKRLLFYETLPSSRSAKFIGAVNTASSLVVLYESTAYLVEDNKLEARTFQGILKQTIGLGEDEGSIVCLDVCGSYLTVGSSSGHVRVWDLSQREARRHAGPKNVITLLASDGSEMRIHHAKCNNKGNKVSVSATTRSGQAHPVLLIWNLDDDAVLKFNFSTGKDENQASNPDQCTKLCSRVPLSHYWDDDDQRLLVCEAKLVEIEPHDDVSNSKAEPEVVVVPLFVTTEHGALVQDVIALDVKKFRLMGVKFPHFFLLGNDVDSEIPSTSAERVPNSRHAFRLTMKDFVGLESSDKDVRDAIMTFSFYVTVGDMDEAFKAIKTIKNEAVWENMAKMCVKSKRMDVAAVCLGKMGNARGAWALRQAEAEPELDARVAVLALQLGMVTEAETLLKECKRYDLLIKLLQDSNRWEDAIEAAEKYWRIRLRATYHDYAHHLEAAGETEKAILMYEKSETHHFEVPRMLFDEPQTLEKYIRKSNNKTLLKWWAQYMESIGEMEAALRYYEAAEDYLSLLRVYCYFNNVEKASEIANETGDRAACFHLARHFENQDNIEEAVHFFGRAKAYGNAIRVCKEHRMDDKLFHLALVAGKNEMIEAASYLEEQPGGLEKAVTLYQRGGWTSKAAQLALQAGDLGALQQAAQDLGPNADRALVETTAQRLVAVGKQDQAVVLLASSGEPQLALNLCLQYNVPINEELCEKLTEAQKDDKAKCSAVLEKIAEACMKQNNYHLAAKKFTQAGNKVQAMKALLKSGDTDKIIFFAGVSRQPEIYVMAANYLQSLDWRQNPDIMKHIITYYTKARAFKLLAGFYGSCAQVEVEEYQNYEKALGAMTEALKCLANNGDSQKEVNKLQKAIEYVRNFVDIQFLYRENPAEAIRQCQELISANPEPAVRRGDIFAFIVRHFVKQKDLGSARKAVEEMQALMPNASLTQFIDSGTLRSVYEDMSIRQTQPVSLFAKHGMKLNGDRESSEDEEVEEDVAAIGGL